MRYKLITNKLVMPHKTCLYGFKTGQVFHTASAGLTGPGQLNKKLCYSVNLDGTR